MYKMKAESESMQKKITIRHSMLRTGIKKLINPIPVETDENTIPNLSNKGLTSLFINSTILTDRFQIKVKNKKPPKGGNKRVR